MILLVFLATLLALSVTGIVLQVKSPQARSLGPCVAASSAAVTFQSAVTRDLRNHARLHADTKSFARELRSLGATTCPGTVRFLGSAEQTVAAICQDCVGELRRAPGTSSTG